MVGKLILIYRHTMPDSNYSQWWGGGKRRVPHKLEPLSKCRLILIQKEKNIRELFFPSLYVGGQLQVTSGIMGSERISEIITWNREWCNDFVLIFEIQGIKPSDILETKLQPYLL